MWMWVRCKATPPYSPALYNPVILLLIYYLIIWLLNNTPLANDYTFVDHLIICDAMWFFHFITPMRFFDFNWLLLIIIVLFRLIMCWLLLDYLDYLHTIFLYYTNHYPVNISFGHLSNHLKHCSLSSYSLIFPSFGCILLSAYIVISWWFRCILFALP